MSRDISALNLAEINASHYHPVLLCKLEFDTPIYAHTDVGTIVYDSNSYLGVGDFGGISVVNESADLRPAELNISLSGINSTHITEALDSGNFGDKVTIYQGYRQADGTLVDDPWILWKGTFNYSQIRQDENDNSVVIVVRHELAYLDEIDGGKFTDEDHQQRYSGDLGFEFVHVMATLKLTWGGRTVSNLNGPPDPPADYLPSI